MSRGQAAPLHLTDLVWRPVSRREPTIDHLDLEIPAGQRVLLAGASGSGKSTVLRALAGLLDPEAGELSGQAPAPARPGERGMLLQNPVHAMVGATVGRDAAFGPENAEMPRPQIHACAAEAVEAARVDVDADRVPLEASGGQQQRIALAGALALAPGALLLDEPTSMLDAPTAQAVRQAILAACEDRTLVVAEHRIGPWLQAVDRLVVLGPKAKVIADGAPEDLLVTQRERLLEAGLDLPPMGEASQQLAPTDNVPAGTPSPSESPSAPVLTASDLCVSRRGRRRGAPLLLQGITVELLPGTMTALVGPSGSGKTTLVRVLLGLDRPRSGTLHSPAPEQIAWVPQNPEHGFVAGTVREEVLASPWATDEALADSLLDRAGIAHLARANPYTLSGGEQRRLAIAAALAQRPRLLVLDEPTVGLDPRRRRDVLSLLRSAREDGCAVLVATHEPVMVREADAVLDLGPHRVDGAGSGAVDRSVAPVEAYSAVDPVGADETAKPGSTVQAVDRRIRPVPRLPRRVPADAFNPLTLCLMGIFAAIGSFGVHTWQGGLLSLVPTLLLLTITLRTVRGTLLRLFPVMFSALGLAWTTALLGEAPALSREAWLVALKEALRITVFVAPGVLTFTCVEPTGLGDALVQRLRFPARPVAAGVAGLVRTGHMRSQWDTIVQARTLRGLGSARSPKLLASATFALLVDGLRGAELQAIAMDARGFATAHRRSWALPSPVRAVDAAGVLIAVVLLIWPWIAEAIVHGGL